MAKKKNTGSGKESGQGKVASFFRREKKYLIGIGTLLGIAVIALCVAGVVYAVRSSVNTDGLIFTLDEETDTYSVTGYEGESTNVVISARYQGKKVTAVAQEAFRDSAVVSVKLHGVETIGRMAFVGCKSLETVELPATLRSIGSMAFASDESLRKIRIPDGVTEIGAYAFTNCTVLAEVTLPDSLTVIPTRCFANCKALRAVSVPDSVTEISERAFEQCVTLTDVRLGRSVRSIGKYAFSGTSGDRMTLASLTLPDTLETIGDSAFMYCDQLTAVSIPAGVKEIAPYAFYEDAALNRVSLPDTLETIGEFAFSGCENLYFLNLPASLTSVGCQAFLSNPWLNSSLAGADGFLIHNGVLLGYFGEETRVTLPDSGYQTVYDGVHSNQTVTSVIVPAGSCRVLGKQSMANCQYLASAVIGEGVTTLGDSLFYYDVNLKYVTLPVSLEVIEDNVFQNCTAMATVYYAGTRDQWKKIIIGEKNDVLNQITVICNSTGPADTAD